MTWTLLLRASTVTEHVYVRISANMQHYAGVEGSLQLHYNTVRSLWLMFMITCLCQHHKREEPQPHRGVSPSLVAVSLQQTGSGQECCQTTSQTFLSACVLTSKQLANDMYLSDYMDKHSFPVCSILSCHPQKCSSNRLTASSSLLYRGTRKTHCRSSGLSSLAFKTRVH